MVVVLFWVGCRFIFLRFELGHQLRCIFTWKERPCIEVLLLERIGIFTDTDASPTCCGASWDWVFVVLANSKVLSQTNRIGSKSG